VSRPDATPLVTAVYERLDAAYRHETWHWMPDQVQGPLDVIVGAVLVQHTTWTNAGRALERLRAAGVLDPEVLARMPEEEIAALVRVGGTPTVKARRLRALAETIVRAGGLERLLALPADELRARLLVTHGVGPETADAIALYAAGARVFMIDAYTQRVFRRVGAGPDSRGYDAWRRWLEDALPDSDVGLFRRYHAYIVVHGKRVCRPRPRCAGCPLLDICADGIARTSER
jgi:endonuclease III related protein